MTKNKYEVLEKWYFHYNPEQGLWNGIPVSEMRRIFTDNTGNPVDFQVISASSLTDIIDHIVGSYDDQKDNN